MDNNLTMYKLEQHKLKISGEYTFKDVITYSNINLLTEFNINFNTYVTKDEHFIKMIMRTYLDENVNQQVFIYYVKEDNTQVTVYDNLNGGWVNYEYQFIKINGVIIGEISYSTSSTVDVFFDNIDLTSVNQYVNLYQMNCEKNKINKESYLDIIGVITGTFRTQNDIANPVLPLALEIDTPKFNYVYISSLERYYFIDNISHSNNNLWILNLHCDVLYSYKDTIYNQYVYLKRTNKTSLIDSDVDDNECNMNSLTSTIYLTMNKQDTILDTSPSNSHSVVVIVNRKASD